MCPLQLLHANRIFLKSDFNFVLLIYYILQIFYSDNISFKRLKAIKTRKHNNVLLPSQ
jgi:hypothetical protein